MDNMFLDVVFESETATPVTTTPPGTQAKQPSSFPTIIVVGVVILVVLAAVLIFRARRK